MLRANPRAWTSPLPPEPILYCLTRDRELAASLDRRLSGALPFFYNDAARLYQAILLRAPALVLVDTDAIRPEYGDAGLGPVVDWLRHRAAAATVMVRPHDGAEQLVVAEAGPGIELVPTDVERCVEAVALRSA
jgi:hypothetical protein